MANYSSVQFMGYQVNTFPVEDPALGNLNPSNQFNQKYLGHTDDRVDIETRCKIMADAIYYARRSNHINISANTLKIFMAPEFYFRGRNGAYPIEEISRIMEKMRAITRQQFYSHWLFVFGTALGYLKDGSSKEIFNIALIQKGGTTSAEKDAARLVYKEYISHIDFIRKNFRWDPLVGLAGDWVEIDWNAPQNRRAIIGGPGHRPSKLRPTQGSRDLRAKHTNPSGRGREMSKSGLGGQSMFLMDNIMFGLEVCLDHAESRLRDSPPGRGRSFAQIQLIPSAGMSINDVAVATATGGLIFNVDSRHVALKRNTGNYAHPSTASIDTRQPVNLAGTQGVQFKGKHDVYFDGGKGTVFIYNTENMPRAKMSR